MFSNSNKLYSSSFLNFKFIFNATYYHAIHKIYVIKNISISNVMQYLIDVQCINI